MKRIRQWGILGSVAVAVLLAASPVVSACPDDRIEEVRDTKLEYSIEVASLALLAKSAGALQSEFGCAEGDQRPECTEYIERREQLNEAFASLEDVVNRYAVALAVAVASGCVSADFAEG